MSTKYSTADVRRAWHDATCPEGEECPDREVHALTFESMSVLDYLPDAPTPDLVELLREHNFDRLVCYDHESGSCDPAGCHDLRITQEEHYARLLSALLPQRVAPNRDDLIKGIDQVVDTRRSMIQRGEGHLLNTVLTDDLADAVAALYASPTVAEVKAEAWAEGYVAGSNARVMNRPTDTPNPYRQEAHHG